MSYIFQKEIMTFSEYSLASEEFEDIMVNSSSQDIITCQNCFAVMKTTELKLEWAMDLFKITRKIISSDGKVKVEIEKTDSVGTRSILVPAEIFNKNKLDVLSKYEIYSNTDDEVREKLSQNFISELKQVSLEQEIENIGFTYDSDGYLGFSGYDAEDPITLELYNSFSSEEKYLKELNTLIQNSIPLQYAISVSASSTLLAYMNMIYDIPVKSFTVNFVGKSTTGKTTAQELCASLYTSIGDQNVFSSFFGTKNAILKSLNVTGIPKIYDEATSFDNFNRENFIYTVSNETEKKRLTQSSELKKSLSWKTIVIISSEESFIDLSRNQHNGIAVRLHCIYGLQFTNSRQHAEEIHRFCSENYGIIGHKLVDLLMNDDDDGSIGQDYDRCRELLREKIGNHSFSLTERLVNEYALIILASDLLKKIGVKTDTSAIMDILLEHHCATLKNVDIARNAYEALMSYVVRNSYNSGIKVMSDKQEIAIEESLFREILNKNHFHDVKTVVNELDTQGYTKRREKNRKKVKLSLNGSSCYCYLLDSSKLEGDEYTGIITEETGDEIISYDNEIVHFDQEE